MSDLKVALIVAGGSGMGAAAARKLAEDGYKVAILSSSGKGETLAEELGGVGITGSNLETADLQRLVDVAMEKWGRIDTVISSAGHGPKGPILELTDDDWSVGWTIIFFERGAYYPHCDADHGSTGKRQLRQHFHLCGIRA